MNLTLEHVLVRVSLKRFVVLLSKIVLYYREEGFPLYWVVIKVIKYDFSIYEYIV